MGGCGQIVSNTWRWGAARRLPCLTAGERFRFESDPDCACEWCKISGEILSVLGIMFYIGTCPVCEAGVLGIRICSDGQTGLVMCDECDTLWTDPRDLGSSQGLAAQGADFTVPGFSFSIAGPASRWATRNEIESRGWFELITGEYLTREEQLDRSSQ